jgi:hypothetical protein
MITFGGKQYDDRHGGPFDRGMADSYYRRRFDPHYFVGGTYNTPRVDRESMTTEELEAYGAGFEYNEDMGDHKDWR